MKIPRLNTRQIRQKSIKITCLLLSVIIGTVQAGCGVQSLETAASGTDTNPSDIYATENTGSTNIGSSLNVSDNLEQDESKEHTAAGTLELIPAAPAVDTQASGNDTVITIGSLILTLPLGWEMEQRISDEGITQYILADVHSEHEGKATSYSDSKIEGHSSIYEHEIVITPYEITRMPYSTLQLAAEMKEYFPVPLLYGIKGTGKTEEIKGCWMCELLPVK